MPNDGVDNKAATTGASEHEQEPQVQTQPEVSTSKHLTRLPSFWETNPRGWFVTAEIMFDANRITGDKQKFSHTVLSLTSQQSELVSYILVDPPENNKYETIKQILIDRYSISEERKLEQIINKVDIGDQKPSDILHRIRTMAGHDFTTKVISKLWIRQLPNYIQAALIPQQDKPEEELAKIADQLHEMVSGRPDTIGAIRRDRRSATNVDTLAAQITKLQQQISELSTSFQREKLNTYGQQQQPRFHPQRARSKSPRRRNFSPSRNFPNQRPQGSNFHLNNQTQSRYQPRPTWCWYHEKYGNAARRCNRPCAFIKRNKTGQTNAVSPNE